MWQVSKRTWEEPTTALLKPGAVHCKQLRGDSFGQLTYSLVLGSSTADYAITDLDLTFLRAFTVKPLTPLSDHSQITIYLKRTATNDNRQKPSQMYKLRPPLRWAQHCTEKYLHTISSQEIQTLLDSFLSNIYPQNREGVDVAVENLNRIFDHATQIINLTVKKNK